MTQFLLYAAAVLCILTGLVGIILPAVPGMSLVVAGCVLAAAADGFTRVGFLPLILITTLGAISFAAEWYGQKLGSEKLGVSKWATAGAIIGSVIGLFFAPWGLVFGPFLGAALLEAFHTQNTGHSVRAGFAALIGLFMTAIMKYLIAALMILIWLFAFFV